jgi:signal transduction histidine kinase
MLVFIDKRSEKNISELISESDLFSKAKNSFYPYSDLTIWTKLTLNNTTAKQLSINIMNDFAALDQVDLYVVKNNEVIRHAAFGDTRSVNSDNLLKRFANASIKIHANSSKDLYIRYKSTTPINIKLMLMSNKTFSNFIISDFTLWGVFIGITIALAVYNFMVFLSLKKAAFLFYVAHAIMNLYNALTTSGHVYAFLSPFFSLEILNLSYKITPSLAMIFMCLFLVTFFELKKNMKWLYMVNVFTILLFSALLLSLLYFYPADKLIVHNKISSIVLQLGLLQMLFTTVATAVKRLSESGYILIGSGTFFTTMLCYIAHYLGLADFGTWIIYASPIGMTVDVILFSLALGKKISRIEKERFNNAVLVEEMNKFNSTSYLLAGILHQFKQPLIYLGSEILNLRTEYFKRGEKAEKETDILNNMEEHVQGMNELVGNFYSFYSKESKILSFNLENSVDKTLKILSSSIKAYNIRVEKQNLNIEISSDEKTLNQIFLVILENAVTALKEREIEQPEINISFVKNSESIISISDNAGGISSTDINKIFNIHYTNKRTEGLGIGLAFAKNLVENKLKGRIEVENSKTGAVFKIILP